MRRGTVLFSKDFLRAPGGHDLFDAALKTMRVESIEDDDDRDLVTIVGECPMFDDVAEGAPEYTFGFSPAGPSTVHVAVVKITRPVVMGEPSRGAFFQSGDFKA